MLFDSVDAAEQFYKRYALAGGFSIRKGTQSIVNNVVRLKYFVCTKEGSRTVKEVDTLSQDYKRKKERRRPSQRTGCNAQLRLVLNDKGKYRVKFFGEAHNHPFVNENDMHFLRASRELTFTQKKVIDDLANINIGPVKAFNIIRTLYGGFDKVGATKSDCKNYKRNINLYIGDYDAEMVLQRLMAKKDFCPNFSCDYITSKEGTLKGLFWADECAKRNFYVFGDVVSFELYKQKLYNMVFVPFTGIDNHNRNVTLGAALLGDETAETYSWLLRCFKSAFGYEPPVVVTEQDPAMKREIEDVFPNSRHRLCMWHIMDKLSGKVGANLCNTTDFKTRLCDIVWTDSITPELFEKGWDSIMTEFNLNDHAWLKDIFQIRDSWIPAYYREENMSGLMRTSSRSESENYFFGKFCNATCTLVEFLAYFETALEHQRHEHQKNDHDCRYKSAKIESNYTLENQAHEIYTRTIFFDVQMEIQKALHNCTSRSYEQVGDFLKFSIRDFEHLPAAFHKVMIRLEDVTVYCGCKRFEQFGLLCRHILKVLHIGDIKVFPRQYINRRWTKDAVSNSPMRSVGFDEPNVDKTTDIYRVVRDINIVNDHIINKLVTDMEKLNQFRDYT
ncbi:protein FAR1-RELATED SEQUENCE 5-like [Bidens hawaiensis]|uniref:protein FAR1-RELATED SEQUENCE 5-like n=1 Tax=Bidens hawaiensis TaxID=980011 RepID=UPI00404AB7E0